MYFLTTALVISVWSSWIADLPLKRVLGGLDFVECDKGCYISLGSAEVKDVKHQFLFSSISSSTTTTTTK